MSEPEVIRQWAQPSTPAVSKPKYPTPNYTRRKQFIVFLGVLGEEQHELEVLAGEGAPTPSSGYSHWVHIQRPQRKALTVLEGYEPFTLAIPVLFDAVRHVGTPKDVEDQIQWLEWMGGRGVKFNGTPYNAAEGDPPLIIVYAADGKGQASQLVPLQFQSASIRWVIDDIIWDEHPIRDRGGARIRQAATVKLLEHVASAGPSTDSSTTRAKLRRGLKGQYQTFHTTSTLNTIHHVVFRYAKGSPSRKGEAIGPTLRANGLGSNPEKPLKPGTAVRIPRTYLVA